MIMVLVLTVLLTVIWVMHFNSYNAHRETHPYLCFVKILLSVEFYFLFLFVCFLQMSQVNHIDQIAPFHSEWFKKNPIFQFSSLQLVRKAVFGCLNCFLSTSHLFLFCIDFCIAAKPEKVGFFVPFYSLVNEWSIWTNELKMQQGDFRCGQKWNQKKRQSS